MLRGECNYQMLFADETALVTEGSSGIALYLQYLQGVQNGSIFGNDRELGQIGLTVTPI